MKISSSGPSDIRRAFGSISFWTASLLLFAMYVQTAWFDLMNVNGDVLYYYEYSRTTSFWMLLYPSLCTLPYSMSFYNEWQSGYMRSVFMRCSTKNYIISKVKACALSGGLSMALGHLLFILMLSLFFPIANINYIPNYSFMEDILKYDLYWLYFLGHIYLILCSGAFWAVLGLAVSPYLTNRYVIVALPFLVSYYTDILSVKLGLSNWMSLGLVRNGFVLNGFIPSLILGTLVFGILTTLLTWVFGYGVRRRFAHG